MLLMLQCYLLEVVDTGVQLGDQHQEAGSEVRVRRLQGVHGLGAAQEDLEEGADPRHPHHLMILSLVRASGCRGVVRMRGRGGLRVRPGQVGEERGHQARLGHLRGAKEQGARRRGKQGAKGKE